MNKQVLNGYQWGVEYETNGKKPDLPDDVFVEIFGSGGVWRNRDRISDCAWDLSKKFRVVDERYKPFEPEKSWHEKGEMPPVGTECEWTDGGKFKNKKVKILAYCGDFAWIKPDKDFPLTVFNPAGFRPLKTERERFVDVVTSLAVKNDIASPEDLAGALYDAGFKAPE